MTSELTKAAPQGEPYGWAVTGSHSLYRGEWAESTARAEAKRCGGTARAFPLYTAPAPQGEPVAAQCRFEGDAEWKPCTVAHHLLVQAHPKEWPHYETRALYTAPAPAVPSDERAALQRIADWSEHPPMLGVDYGSNGVRDYYRKIARAALTAAPTPPAQPAVPEDVAREPMTQRWCWWIGDAETFHIADTESEAHGEARCSIDYDCEPGDTREYSVGRVQHPIDALGVDWLAEHVAETIEENTREWCDDNTGAEDQSITLAAEDRKVLGTMVAAFLREKVSVHWWTADQKTITTHTYVAGSNDADAARAAEKGGE